MPRRFSFGSGIYGTYKLAGSSAAQWEDIEVLEHLDDIIAVEGIDLFSSGAQDIAQSMGLQGQPNHPRVKEFEAEVASRVHAAGRKMTSDVFVAAGASCFLRGPENSCGPKRAANVLPSRVWNFKGDSEWESPICTHHWTNIDMNT